MAQTHKQKMEAYRKQIKQLDYPNGDHLELDVDYVWSRSQWKASLTGMQRRGFCNYVSCVGRDYYADTPEGAAAKAVANAPRNWAYEPDKHRVVTKGQASWYESIPIEREACAKQPAGAVPPAPTDVTALKL